jgi:hypothetical protein
MELLYRQMMAGRLLSSLDLPKMGSVVVMSMTFLSPLFVDVIQL